MILDNDAQYALVKPNIVFSIDGKLIEWPGSGTAEFKRMRVRTLFKVASPLWKYRRVKLEVDWGGQAVIAQAYATDLFLLRLEEYENLQEVWVKQDQVAVYKKDIGNLENELDPLLKKVETLQSKIALKIKMIDVLNDEIKPMLTKFETEELIEDDSEDDI